MSSIRKPGAPLAGAVVWVAVLLFALAPAVSALCALDVPVVGSSAGTVQAATVPEDRTGHHDDDPSCAPMSAPVIESSKPFGMSLAGSMQPVGPSVAATRETAVMAFSVARPIARLPAPPPEPVSRRFPRLLI